MSHILQLFIWHVVCGGIVSVIFSLILMVLATGVSFCGTRTVYKNVKIFWYTIDPIDKHITMISKDGETTPSLWTVRECIPLTITLIVASFFVGIQCILAVIVSVFSMNKVPSYHYRICRAYFMIRQVHIVD
eukprot:162735_1